jgi:hypothetical protein
MKIALGSGCKNYGQEPHFRARAAVILDRNRTVGASAEHAQWVRDEAFQISATSIKMMVYGW